jgi:hypothetical protein
MSVEEYRSTALENPLRSAVVEYLRLKGYVVAVTDAALSVCKECGTLNRASVDEGWPDVSGVRKVIVGGQYIGQALFVETKTARGRLRPSQIACHAALRAAGAVVVVPRSLDDLRRAIEGGL